MTICSHILFNLKKYKETQDSLAILKYFFLFAIFIYVALYRKGGILRHRNPTNR